MNKLTSEQMVWAMRWAADYLEQHREEDTALESLRYYADMTEKHSASSKAVVMGVDMASSKDRSATTIIKNGRVSDE